ncbi:hypothetical protein X975_10735, partial [Stegodyphus mimosarum]
MATGHGSPVHPHLTLAGHSLLTRGPASSVCIRSTQNPTDAMIQPRTSNA